MFRRPVVWVQPGEVRTEYITREIHEHRAPTDESVALLKEMETAAQAKIIDTVKVGDAAFECVVHTMRDDLSQDHIAVAIFSLNGRKLRAESRMRLDRLDGNKNAWAADLRDAIAQEIATHILTPALARILQ